MISGHGSAQFENADQAFVAYEAFEEWAGKANESSVADFEVSLVAKSGLYVHFAIDSEKERNFDWQVRQVVRFLKTQPGVQSVDVEVERTYKEDQCHFNVKDGLDLVGNDDADDWTPEQG